MDEEKKIEEKSKTEEKPKSKRWCLCCGIPVGLAVLIVVLILVGRTIFPSLGGLFNASNSIPDTGVVGPKDFVYAEPSAAAKTRQLDCYQYRFYTKSQKLLCLNLYQTSAEDIKQKLAASSYDRLVLYGDKALYDADPNTTEIQNLPERLYMYAKFSDGITIPKMMSYFGLKNLDYISRDFVPNYGALHIAFYDKAKLLEICKVDSGCASEGFAITLSNNYLSEKYQGPLPTNSYHRDELDTSLYYKIKWPSNCYISGTILHETAHMLFNAQTISLMRRVYTTKAEDIYPPEWFDEQQAGFWEAWGPELVCGPGVYTDFSGTWESKKDDNLRLVKFQTQYPPNPLSHDFPKDEPCKLAIVTEFYRFLNKGPLEEQMPKFYTASLPYIKDKSIYDTKVFTSFVLGLNGNDPVEKEFLNSKSCGI